MFINERILAAYDYFYDKLDQLEYKMLYKIEEIKRVKQVKQFYDELIIIEELQVKAILQLMKANRMIETINDRKTISKETLNSSEIKDYRISKIAVSYTHLDVYKRQIRNRL